MALAKIGGLWLKDGKRGKFMSGEIEIGRTKHRILVFKNEEKEGKQPDYRIMLADDDNERPNAERRPSQVDDIMAPPDDSDVPF